MDYSLTNAMNHNMAKITRVISFYDINCSYMKKLRYRISNSPYLSIPKDLKILPGIGIWHVHGHRPECFSRYAPLFIPGSGWVDGEIMETLWSILNVVSGSARGMSSPHRQELLDFQMNDSNFMKMIRMCKVLLLSHELADIMLVAQSLTRKLRVARRSSASASASFNALDASITDMQRQVWETQEKNAFRKQMTNPSAMDIFELQLEKGLWDMPNMI